jgi:hypothetical protein
MTDGRGRWRPTLGYITFQSSIVDPSGIEKVTKFVMRPLGLAHATVLYDALAGVRRPIGEPRLYFPIACWGFQCRVNDGRIIVLVRGVNQDVLNEGTNWIIELSSLDFALFRRKSISASLDAIKSVLSTFIGGDGRLSNLQEHTAKQFREIERVASRTNAV